MSQSDDAHRDEVRWLFKLDRVLKAVGAICLYAGMAFITAIAVMTVVHVIMRYAFSKPIVGQAELAILMLITGAFLIITPTQLVKGHTTIGLIVDRFSKKTQTIIDSFTYFLCLAVTALLFWQSIVRADYVMQAGRETTILGIPLFPVYYVVAVGWGLISLVILTQLIRFILTLVKR